MSATGDLSHSRLSRLRWAVAFAAVAVVLAMALLFKETAYLFTTFMFLGPALLLVAMALLVWTILEDLKANRVL